MNQFCISVVFWGRWTTGGPRWTTGGWRLADDHWRAANCQPASWGRLDVPRISPFLDLGGLSFVHLTFYGPFLLWSSRWSQIEKVTEISPFLDLGDLPKVPLFTFSHLCLCFLNHLTLYGPIQTLSIFFYFEAPSTIAPLRKQSSMDDFLALNTITSWTPISANSSQFNQPTGACLCQNWRP